MNEFPPPAETFSEIVLRICAQANELPEHERIGFLKGAIQNAAGLSEPDREAAYAIAVTAGSGVTFATSNTVNVTNTLAPVQNQTASPQFVASPSISQTTTTPAQEPSGSSRRNVIIALITLAGTIAAALIQARFSRKPSDPTPETPPDSDSIGIRPAPIDRKSPTRKPIRR